MLVFAKTFNVETCALPVCSCKSSPVQQIFLTKREDHGLLLVLNRLRVPKPAYCPCKMFPMHTHKGFEERGKRKEEKEF